MNVRVGNAKLFLPALHVPMFIDNQISVGQLAQKFNLYQGLCLPIQDGTTTSISHTSRVPHGTKHQCRRRRTWGRHLRALHTIHKSKTKTTAPRDTTHVRLEHQRAKNLS